ncbi:outer membrane protein assembly factor BamB family protein [Anatilimnocola floriformis]|uniref:outer membrane protein assembly factor BamB family protein n=1 Tax=Anatilimnocola floriformis TaxID=2948575 RepID=UPI0020C3DAE8|nr:PQQ-binding-like beta-propeller repeat protein [Anatilimnocola floriformis]
MSRACRGWLLLWLLIPATCAAESDFGPLIDLIERATDPPGELRLNTGTLAEMQQLPSTPAAAAELLRNRANHTSEQRTGWLRDLDADDYRVREASMQQLMQLPHIPREEWKQQIATAGPERRWRLRRILDRHEMESTHVYRAALQLLAQDPSVLRDSDWLAAAIILERADLRDEYVSFLRQHVTAALVPQFRQAASDERLASRLAAAVVLSRSADEVDQPLLAKLLSDKQDEVSFLAAQGVAQRGDARALPVLIRLLDSTQLEIRSQSATWLCGLTGQEFDYSPYAAAADRHAAMARWRDWLNGPGATAAIQPPQRMAVPGRGNLNGHTLVATGGMGKISEVDAQGQVLWQRSMQAWSAEKVPGGNVLIASHWENRVIEVDERGQVVWQLEGVNAIRAKPLPSGHVLIADFGGNRVVEANRNGTIVWQQATPDQCFDAERLVSGNTIFACPNLIREVSPSGASVRQWTIEGRINSLQVLPSGRLLTANYGQGRVVELDEQGQVTWEYKIARPSDAFRLPGGRTLITTAEQIIEVDLQGRQIRQISAAVNGGARQ